MNTTPESLKTPNRPVSRDTEIIARTAVTPDSTNAKLAEAASALGDDVEEAKDYRGEERFLWSVACICLFDCFAFSQMESWSGPVVIGIIQLIFVIALAKVLGVEEIAKFLTQFLFRMSDYDKKG